MLFLFLFFFFKSRSQTGISFISIHKNPKQIHFCNSKIKELCLVARAQSPGTTSNTSHVKLFFSFTDHVSIYTCSIRRSVNNTVSLPVSGCEEHHEVERGAFI